MAAMTVAAMTAARNRSAQITERKRLLAEAPSRDFARIRGAAPRIQ